MAFLVVYMEMYMGSCCGRLLAVLDGKLILLLHFIVVQASLDTVEQSVNLTDGSVDSVDGSREIGNDFLSTISRVKRATIERRSHARHAVSVAQRGICRVPSWTGAARGLAALRAIVSLQTKVA